MRVLAEARIVGSETITDSQKELRGCEVGWVLYTGAISALQQRALEPP